MREIIEVTLFVVAAMGAAMLIFVAASAIANVIFAAARQTRRKRRLGYGKDD